MSLEFDLQFPLRDFDLEMSGEFQIGITGLFGPSGAGKTSLFNLLAGLNKPEKGYISLGHRMLTDTHSGKDVPVHKRKIGFVFQEKLLFPHMTVRENLLFGLPYAKRKIISLGEIVDFLKLEDLLDAKPHEISGGEQQRTAMGRALMTSPELLLLDEPFNAVDYEHRSSILHCIKELEERMQIPILVISHDREDLKKLTDRICLVSRGRLKGPGRFFEKVV